MRLLLFLLLLPFPARAGGQTIVSGIDAPGGPKADRELYRKFLKQYYNEQVHRVPKPVECVALPVGKSKVIDWDENSSLTYIPARYRLTRLEWGKFLVEVNPRFRKAAGYKSALSDAEIDTKYLEKARSCLQEMSPRLMYGGEGGSVDPIRLELRATRDPKLPEVPIEIGPEGVRSHSQLYVESIDCLTMLHETLHLLGLADKYEEAVSGFSWDPEVGAYRLQSVGAEFKFNCRKVQSSVMQRQDDAARETAPLVRWKVTQCRCAPGADCPALAKTASGSQCPEGTTPETGEQQIPEGSSVANMVTNVFFVLPGGPHERAGAGPTKRSLLTSAEFFHLVMPGCEKLNPCFYACERNAYRFEDSTPRPDALPNANRGCMPLPPECGKKIDVCIDHPYSLYDVLNATSPHPDELENPLKDLVSP